MKLLAVIIIAIIVFGFAYLLAAFIAWDIKWICLISKIGPLGRIVFVGWGFLTTACFLSVIKAID